MKEFSYQMGLLFSLYPVVKWLFVLIGVLLLLFSIYKMTIVQRVAPNGRIESRFQKPAIRLRKPNINVPVSHAEYTDRELKLLSNLYIAQQLIFGILLFIFGLGLCVLAYLWIFESLTSFSIVWKLLAAIAGIALMICGYLAAYHRNLGNPFTDTT